MFQFSPVPITKALHWGDRFVSSLMSRHRTLLTEDPSYHWRSLSAGLDIFCGMASALRYNTERSHCPQSVPSVFPDSLVPPSLRPLCSRYGVHNLDFPIMPCHCDKTVHHQFRDTTCSPMMSNVVVQWMAPDTVLSEGTVLVHCHRQCMRFPSTAPHTLGQNA